MAISLGILTQHFQTNPYSHLYEFRASTLWVGPNLGAAPGFYESLEPYPGAVDALNRLLEEGADPCS